MSDPNSPRQRPTPPAGDAARSASPAAPAQPQSSSAKQPATPAGSAADANTPPKSRSGHVTHDERGNAIWEWVTTTTKNAILSATSLLKKLDSTELSLEEPPAKDDKAAMLPKHRPGGGFNPYEQANKSRGKK